MAACGHLDPVSKPVGYLLHEGAGVVCIPTAYRIGDDQLVVGVQAGPRPQIARLGRRSLGGLYVPLLAVNEGPDFITLDPLGTDTPDRFIVEGFASLPGVPQ